MASHAAMTVLLFFLITLHLVAGHGNLTRARVAARALAGMPGIQEDGDNTTLTSKEFALFLTSIGNHAEDFVRASRPCQSEGGCSQCPGIGKLFDEIARNGRISADEIVEVLPVTIQTMLSPNCCHGHGETQEGKETHTKITPTTEQTWAYGVGFTSIVILISNIGACLGPMMDKTFFQRLLQFLVAMGGGSLAATGLLVLIPEAFDIMAAKELGTDYVWKSTVAVFSIYFFFICERLLKIFIFTKTQKKNKAGGNGKNLDLDDLESDAEKPLAEKFPENDHGHSHVSVGNDSGAPSTLAWMVMAGDMIHNFVDGLAIGAAFSTDISVGISISLAVVCEELPHELADIAILLHSGFRISRALLINFISACFIYLGLVIGILLGSTIQAASRWIFAIAGGLFLYVPLVDMLPEMSNHLDREMAKGGRGAQIVACLHVVGLVIGTGIIILIVNVTQFIIV